MDVLRYAAFSSDTAGGNPAGVVLDARGADAEQMLQVAAAVGYSETAFLFPADGDEMEVRYFSPKAEVSFCGHATIATAVAFAERHGIGTMRLRTQSGLVSVESSSTAEGQLTATLTSVPPTTKSLQEADLAEILRALDWQADDLDDTLPPRVAFAGAWHPIIAVRSRARLAALRYDFAALAAIMQSRSWTTVDLVWRESPETFHCRNPFPPGGVVEDPATGAAAAAFGGYLRELGLVHPPISITVYQGDDLGRPSLLTVHIPEGSGGIEVTGTAVSMDDAGRPTEADR